MSYNHAKLAERLAALLEQRPATKLTEAAVRLGVHRHTLHSAIAAAGGDFASLRRQAVLRCVEQSLANGGALKQAWVAAGFSSGSAFARYIRRATGRSPTALRRGYVSGQNATELAQTVVVLQRRRK